MRHSDQRDFGRQGAGVVSHDYVRGVDLEVNYPIRLVCLPDRLNHLFSFSLTYAA